VKKKLLLHLCCAPCAIFVWQKLAGEYEVAGFFYNPNIQPHREYLFRIREIQKIADQQGWRLFIGPYDMENWFDQTRQLRHEPERGRRCSLCFGLRLDKTFQVAQKKGYHIVASTLSISPYKVTAQINQEGIRLSRQYGIEFLAENFKKQGGYDKARQMARECGINHQTYCGCVYSKAEGMIKTREK
jgi:predicted adenine nucleotide alpha hydrolase (AANH) superfamily ATPase